MNTAAECHPPQRQLVKSWRCVLVHHSLDLALCDFCSPQSQKDCESQYLSWFQTLRTVQPKTAGKKTPEPLLKGEKQWDSHVQSEGRILRGFGNVSFTVICALLEHALLFNHTCILRIALSVILLFHKLTMQVVCETSKGWALWWQRYQYYAVTLGFIFKIFPQSETRGWSGEWWQGGKALGVVLSSWQWLPTVIPVGMQKK